MAKRGFTLLEMSVVLLTIALLIAGIMVGKSLIHNAQLQSVIADVDRYEKAVQLFRDKYHELPGDMPNATSFWGDAGSACTSPAHGAPLTSATCNGDGNGQIESQNYLGMFESILAWQHLANAKLIDGMYNVTDDVTGLSSVVPGVNVPASKILPNGFTFAYIYYWLGYGFIPTNTNGHILSYGDSSNDCCVSGLMGGLAPTDALSIDKKMDDGMPGTGNVVSTYAHGCTTDSMSIYATYDTTQGEKACPLFFIPGF